MGMSRGGLGPRLYTHVYCSCNVNAGVSNCTQVQVATSSEELQALIQEEEFDFRFRCGYSKPVAQIDISDRDEFIQAIWLHHVLFQPYAELEQLKNGLKDTLQFELMLTLYATEMWSLFAGTNAYDVSVTFYLIPL